MFVKAPLDTFWEIQPNTSLLSAVYRYNEALDRVKKVAAAGTIVAHLNVKSFYDLCPTFAKSMAHEQALV